MGLLRRVPDYSGLSLPVEEGEVIYQEERMDVYACAEWMGAALNSVATLTARVEELEGALRKAEESRSKLWLEMYHALHGDGDGK